MSSEKPTQMKSIIEAEKSIFTPKIEDGQLSIEFSIQPAINQNGSTLALFVAYKLGHPYLGVYGGQLGQAINIVAIHSKSGKVFFSPPVTSDAIPISDMMIDEKDIGPLENLPSAMSSYFNVDLCELLRLPPEGGIFHVFLWMDDIVTSIQTVEVPENINRLYPSLPLKAPAEKNIIKPDEGDEGKGDSEAENKAIHLEAMDEKPTKMDHSDLLKLRIGGTIPNEIFSKEESKDVYKPPLVAMAFCHRSRNFGSQSISILDDTLESKTPSFMFDLLRLVDCSETPQKIFVFTTLGEHQSNMLTISYSPEK
jgi:hypothetical protein